MFPKRFAQRIVPRVVRENRYARLALIVILGGIGVHLLLGVLAHRAISEILAREESRAVEARPLAMIRQAKLFKDLKETTEERKLIQRLRLALEDLVPFLQRLETAAQEAGVAQTIETVPVEERAAAPAAEAPLLRYRLKLEGTLDGITAYLATLDRIPQVVIVEEVRITSSRDEDLLVGARADVRVAVAIRE